MLLSAFMGTLSLSGQLNTLHNHYRAGDVLIKQQVEYLDPGKSGVNQVWDFSKLKTINDQYTLTYSLPPLEGDSVYILGNKRYKKENTPDNSLIVATEHNTMYYYNMTNDTLFLTGHENPVVRLSYLRPMVSLTLPMNFGQTSTSPYRTKGLYSGTIGIQSVGEVIVSADAYGKIILPSGDTLTPVLRVKTHQTIFDIPNKWSQNTRVDDKGKLLETCRWYSKGYRYPVFETVRNINIADSTTIFSTAFFYPPQDHLYLDTDPENQALLDELWKDTETNQNNITNIANQEGKTVSLEDIMTCKIYPNPVESVMYLEYELKQDAKVSFDLYSIEGMPIKKISPKNKTKGMYNESIDCSKLQSKNYVLRISADNVFVNEIVIKK